MDSVRNNYWSDAIGEALSEIGKYELFTSSEIDELGEALAVSAENQSLAFYTPPASDRLNQIEREWKAKHDALQSEFDRYRNNAETAVRRSLRQRSDANVSIGENGEVLRYDGRMEVIQ